MACAVSLLAQRSKVTMIDVGRDMAPARQLRLNAIAAQEPADWSLQDRCWMGASLRNSREAVPPKSLFGDTFMYDGMDSVLEPSAVPRDFALRPSHALGGFSRVWGGTLSRLDSEDLEDWPISTADLVYHYDKIQELIPMMGGDRSALCEQHENSLSDFPLSPQAARVLSRWKRNAGALNALRAQVTPGWLAVHPDCRLCGNCLHGCPYGYIFSTTEWVRSSRDGFLHRSGLRAVHLEENGSKARVHCTTEDGAITSLSADRIFVAAGVLGTSRLILASFGDRSARLTLRDSQYFILPFITSEAHPPRVQHHTLSQLFVCIDDPVVSDARVHVQFYTYNDVYAARIARKAGPLRNSAVVKRLAEVAGRRMVLAMGYLHSREFADGTAVARWS